jgi:hypothetical protein
MRQGDMTAWMNNPTRSRLYRARHLVPQAVQDSFLRQYPQKEARRWGWDLWQEETWTAEVRQPKGQHLRIRYAPTGERIYLATAYPVKLIPDAVLLAAKAAAPGGALLGASEVLHFRK